LIAFLGLQHDKITLELSASICEYLICENQPEDYNETEIIELVLK